MPFSLKISKKYKINDETFKIELYLDSYKSSTD